METRVCTGCHTEQPLSNFSRDRTKRSGHRSRCRPCCRAQQQDWEQRHPGASKQRRAQHRERYNGNARARYNANPEPRRHYRQTHRQHILAYLVQWRLDHPEYIRTHNQHYRLDHREALRLYHAAYCAEHPEYRQAKLMRRRARAKRAAINDFSRAQWEEMKHIYEHCCAYCGKHMQRLTQDHIVPFTKGGVHTWSNIVPACPSCNSKKGTGPILAPIQLLLFLLAPPKPFKPKQRTAPVPNAYRETLTPGQAVQQQGA